MLGGMVDPHAFRWSGWLGCADHEPFRMGGVGLREDVSAVMVDLL